MGGDPAGLPLRAGAGVLGAQGAEGGARGLEGPGVRIRERGRGRVSWVLISEVVGAGGIGCGVGARDDGWWFRSTRSGAGAAAAPPTLSRGFAAAA